MSFLALIVSVVFTVAMLFQILRPFLASRSDQLRYEVLEDDLREIETLMDRKAALVQMLRDLEYDYETAKIAEEDYQRFKRSCERQAVAVMRRLDTIHGGRHWQSVIDDALADFLGTGTPPEHADWLTADAAGAAETAETAEITDTAVEPSRTPTEAPAEQESHAPNCGACSALLEEDDRFCGKCGSPVHEIPEAGVEPAPKIKATR